VTFAAEGAAGVADETRVSQHTIATRTPETLWMPRIVHCFDDAPDDERFTFAAARGKQNVEVVLAILALLKLEEYAIFKRLKTLSADETSGMPGFLAAIDDLLIIAESLAALRTTLIITT